VARDTSLEAEAWRTPPSANAMEPSPVDGTPVVKSAAARNTAWVLVGSILVGCVVVALGIVLGQWPTALVGAAIAVIAGILAFALPRAGKSAPISLGVEYPAHTIGPRGDDGAHVPPIDTHPHGTPS